MSDLFGSLMRATPALPPDLLRSVYRDARRRDDHDCLVDLVARADLPVDVLLELADETDPAITAAYRARPTRPDQLTMRRPEKRHTVLAKALGRYGDGDPVAFRDALDAFMTKPSLALLKVLSVRPATWYTPSESAALLLALDRATTLDPQRDTVHALVSRLGPDAAAELAPAVRGWRIRHALLCYDLRPATVADIVHDALLHGYDQSSSLGRTALLPPVQARKDAAELLLERLRHGDSAARRHIETVQRWLSSPPNTDLKVLDFDTSPANPPTVARDFTHADPAVLVAAATSPDPDVLREVVDRQVTNPAADFHSSTHIVTNLLRNAHLDVTDARRLINRLPTQSQHGWSTSRALGSLDVLTLWDDPEVCQTWAQKFPHHVLLTHGWEPFGGPQCASDLLGTWINQHRTGQREPDFLAAVLRAAVTTGISDDDLLALPVDVVTTHLLWGNRAEEYCTAADRIARLLNDRMPPGQWGVFEQLLPTFTGSLADLLTVVTSVAA